MMETEDAQHHPHQPDDDDVENDRGGSNDQRENLESIGNGDPAEESFQRNADSWRSMPIESSPSATSEDELLSNVLMTSVDSNSNLHDLEEEFHQLMTPRRTYSDGHKLFEEVVKTVTADRDIIEDINQRSTCTLSATITEFIGTNVDGEAFPVAPFVNTVLNQDSEPCQDQQSPDTTIISCTETEFEKLMDMTVALENISERIHVSEHAVEEYFHHMDSQLQTDRQSLLKNRDELSSRLSESEKRNGYLEQELSSVRAEQQENYSSMVEEMDQLAERLKTSEETKDVVERRLMELMDSSEKQREIYEEQLDRLSQETRDSWEKRLAFEVATMWTWMDDARVLGVFEETNLAYRVAEQLVDSGKRVLEVEGRARTFAEENEGLRLELSECTKRANQFEEDLVCLKERYSVLETEKLGLAIEVSQYIGQQETLTTRVAELTEDCNLNKTANAQLTSNAQALTIQNDNLNAMVRDSTEALNDIQNQFSESASTVLAMQIERNDLSDRLHAAEELSSSNRQNSQLASQNEILNHQLEDTKQELNLVQAAKGYLEQQLAQTVRADTEKLETLANELENVQRFLDSVQKGNGSLKLQIASLDAENGNLAESVEKLKEALEVSSRRVKELDEELAETLHERKTELLELQRLASAHEEDRSALENRLRQNTVSVLEERRNVLSWLGAFEESVESQLDSLSAAFVDRSSHFAAQCQKLCASVAETRRCCSVLEGSRSNLLNALGSVSARLRKTEQEKDEAVSQFETLKSRVDELQDQLDEFVGSLKLSEDANRTAEEKLTTLSATNSVLETRLRELGVECSNLETALAGAGNIIGEHENRLEERHQEVSDLSDCLRELRDLNRTANAQSAALCDDLRALQHRFDEATEWRKTAEDMHKNSEEELAVCSAANRDLEDKVRECVSKCQELEREVEDRCGEIAVFLKFRDQTKDVVELSERLRVSEKLNEAAASETEGLNKELHELRYQSDRVYLCLKTAEESKQSAEEQLTVFVASNAVLKNQVTEYARNFEDLKGQVGTAKDEVAALETQLNDRIREASEFSQHLRTSEELKEAATSEVAILTDELHELRKQFDQTAESLKVAEDAHRTAEERGTQLENQVNDHVSRSENLKEEVTTAEKELEDYRTQREECLQELRELSQRLQTSENLERESFCQLTALNEQLGELQRHFVETELSLQQTEDSRRTPEETLAVLTVSHREMINKVTSLELNLASEKDSHVAIQKQLDQQIQKTREISQRLQASEQLKDDSMNQIAVMTVQNMKERDDFARQLSKLAERLKNSETGETQLKELRNQLSKGSSEFADLQKQCDLLQAEVRTSNGRCIDLEKERDHVRHELCWAVERHHDAEQLKAELESRISQNVQESKRFFQLINELRREIGLGSLGKEESEAQYKTVVDGRGDLAEQGCQFGKNYSQEREDLFAAVTDTVGLARKVNDHLLRQNKCLIKHLGDFLEPARTSETTTELFCEENCNGCENIVQNLAKLQRSFALQGHQLHEVETQLTTANAKKGVDSALKAHCEQLQRELQKESALRVSLENICSGLKGRIATSEQFERALHERVAILTAQLDALKEQRTVNETLVQTPVASLNVTNASAVDNGFGDGTTFYHVGSVRSLVSKMDRGASSVVPIPAGGVSVAYHSPARSSVGRTFDSARSSGSKVHMERNLSSSSFRYKRDVADEVETSNDFGRLANSSTGNNDHSLTEQHLINLEKEARIERQRRKELEAEVVALMDSNKTATKAISQWEEAFSTLKNAYEWKNERDKAVGQERQKVRLVPETCNLDPPFETASPSRNDNPFERRVKVTNGRNVIAVLQSTVGVETDRQISKATYEHSYRADRKHFQR